MRRRANVHGQAQRRVTALLMYIYALKTAADKAASLAVMTDKYTETCRREDVICGYNGGKGALWDMYDRE